MTIINQSDVLETSTAKLPFTATPLSKRIRALVLTGISLSFLVGPVAFAQGDSQEEPKEELKKEAKGASAEKVVSTSKKEVPPESMEEVVVSGHRFSQRSAIDRKKNAGTMSDSLVAEDIGEFPDKNVAEALQRIAGIQLARDFGEGAQVSIRGVDPDLSRVEVNGVSQMGMGGSRAVDFRDMASELVKSLDVIKGSEARFTEGGLGGIVKINTRKPNEFDSNFLSVSGEQQYNDLSDASDPRINVTGVWKFNEDFGALMNVTASETTAMIHALRNTEWHRIADYDNSPEKTVLNEDYASIDNVAGCNGEADCEEQWWDYAPRLPRVGVWWREEERLSANTIFQYNFSDNFSAYAGFTYNERDKEATDLNLDVGIHSAARIDANSVQVDENHNVTYLESSQASVGNRTLNFAWYQETSIVDTGFEFSSGPWEITGLAAYSASEQDIDSRDTSISANGIAGIQVALDHRGAPSWDYSTGYFYNAADPTDTSQAFDVNSPASYSTARFKYAPSADETSEANVKLDVVYNFEDGFIQRLRTGIQATSNSAETEGYNYNIFRNVGEEYNGQMWTREDHLALLSGNFFESPELFEGYDLGVSTIGSYQAVDTNGLIAAMRQASNDNTTREDLEIQSGNYDITVETEALYLQTDFATEVGGMPFWGNFGVRYIVTNTETNGDYVEHEYRNVLDEDGDILVNPETGIALLEIAWDVYNDRKTVSREYSDTLPSINMNLELIPEKLVLYMGAAKVMSRPRNRDLNVNGVCYQMDDSLWAEQVGWESFCKGGNPALNPYRANQGDIALSWYPNEDSIVSAAYFAKNMESWILGRDERLDVDFLGDGRVWDVTQPVNGEGVKTRGVELQASTFFTMLPYPFNGLGGSVNYTHMTADNVGLLNELTGEELPMPSQSENSYNVTAFWEGNGFSARLAYNYRDEYLANPADRSGNPVFVEDAGYLDAKMSYTLPNSNLRFFLDARNLLEQAKVATAGEHRLSDLSYSGRQFALGVSYKM
ncbi:TonB-dependent receptor [Microbulbifer rhizosphaerae]|uniref:TonB-dependent receptor n=1 Tax=Microbulbifer rhizosphaerae TaxID=1562603 RepID=A0A7W4ZAG3_9GAMM|nr:TonB-dependent receptor [Microbulbifer rhizosphaerae]MBB3061255.1 TonB-dependent receptor [Microbulbifer rhizosphaerae]